MDRAVPMIPVLALACQPSGELVLATEIVEAPGHTGEGNLDSALAVNGVRGGGALQGSVDVFSLGLEPGLDDVLVLGFEGGRAVDVEGPDLAVFENPFDVQGTTGRFFDPVVVEVSADCETFVALPHALQAGSPDAPIDDPAPWLGFAGIEPVYLHEEDNPVDPFSAAAGGDRLDLAELDPADPTAAAVLEDGALCVRLSSAVLWTDPQTGAPFPAHPASNGADIDGVYAASVVR